MPRTSGSCYDITETVLNFRMLYLSIILSKQRLNKKRTNRADVQAALPFCEGHVFTLLRRARLIYALAHQNYFNVGWILRFL